MYKVLLNKGFFSDKYIQKIFEAICSNIFERKKLINYKAASFVLLFFPSWSSRVNQQLQFKPLQPLATESSVKLIVGNLQSNINLQSKYNINAK